MPSPDTPDIPFSAPTRLYDDHVKFCAGKKDDERIEKIRRMTEVWADTLNSRKRRSSKALLWESMERALETRQGKEPLEPGEVARIRDMVSAAVKVPFSPLNTKD